MPGKIILTLMLAGSFGRVLLAEELVPLKPKLPAPAFTGTPKEIPVGVNIDSAADKAAFPLLIPKQAINLAPKANVSSSDTNATLAALAKVIDGVKEADDANVVLLKKGIQYLQFDLGTPAKIYAVVLWHAHDSPKVYHGVIAQISNDPAFAVNPQTIFNNDAANEARRGAGKDHEYFETYEGKIINGQGIAGRYVRLYSHGSTDGSFNEYTEVEIYGIPVK